MCSHILYEVEIYIPRIFTEKGLLDMSDLNSLFVRYDIDHKIPRCEKGRMRLESLYFDQVSELLHNILRRGTTYYVTINEHELTEFVGKLPNNLLILRVSYLPNEKNHKWIQTDDLSWKFSEMEILDEPSDHTQTKYKYTNVLGHIETQNDSTQTDMIQNREESQSGSEGYSCSCDYDTSYSLEMWQVLRSNVIVYCSQHFDHSPRDEFEYKLMLSKTELECKMICQKLEDEFVKKYPV